MANTNTLRDVPAWHAMSQALSEASARLQQYGPNRLPEGRKRGPFTISCKQGSEFRRQRGMTANFLLQKRSSRKYSPSVPRAGLNEEELAG
jgi:hypothetical protein